MTPTERSERSKKAWRSRKKRDAATIPDRGGPLPATRTADKDIVGYERIMAASTPEKSSAAVARELGVTAAYVRGVWRLKGRPRRPAGKRPPICATSR